MQIRDEGEAAFFKKMEELIDHTPLREEDHLLCQKIEQRIRAGRSGIRYY